MNDYDEIVITYIEPVELTAEEIYVRFSSGGLVFFKNMTKEEFEERFGNNK